MVRPFQCLYYCSSHGSSRNDILLAASGPRIFSFDISGGTLLSTWASAGDVEGTKNILNSDFEDEFKGADKGVEEKSVSQDLDAERPGKRRKISPRGSGSERVSTEIIVEGRSGGSDTAASTPAVIKLAGSSNGKYVVAVTGDDKCIRVFEVHGNGNLIEHSKRYMPKRPCAVVLTPDDSTILCADKFGDVYSLPLVGHSPGKDPQTPSTDSTAINRDEEPSHRPFVPAASTLTVHTRRNQQALKNQQKLTNQQKTKKPLEFEHKLVLGHVSLLTDLAYVTLGASESSLAKKRSYILTSDRDEHVRVSRGLPQAHIIDGYCLGHTEFVSKLCVPHWQPQLLVSGGGDDYILLWDWISGNARLRVDLKSPLDELWKSYTMSVPKGQDSVPQGVIEKIAVSGIWNIQHHRASEHALEGEIIVACEGIPALLFYSLNSQGSLNFRQCLSVAGNVLDVAVLEDRSTIFYSLDNIHEKWSTKVVDKGPLRTSVGAVTFSESAQRWNEEAEGTIMVINQEALAQDKLLQDGSGKDTVLCEFLYIIENFRKRGQGQED